MKIKDGKHEEIIKKNYEATRDLKLKGLQVEKYIVSRSYRGNTFDLIDMLGLDTYLFFTNYSTLIDTDLRNQELMMRQREQSTKMMVKFIEGGEQKFYMPPIFDVCTIKEMKMDAQNKTQLPCDYS